VRANAIVSSGIGENVGITSEVTALISASSKNALMMVEIAGWRRAFSRGCTRAIMIWYYGIREVKIPFQDDHQSAHTCSTGIVERLQLSSLWYLYPFHRSCRGAEGMRGLLS
jgi:hypothetical protein